MAASSRGSEHDPQALSLGWLLRFRWGVVLALGLFITMAGPTLHLALPTGLLLAIVGAAALTNLAAHLLWRQRQPPSWAIPGLLGTDFLAFTALLYCTGGSHNPFVLSYLVLIVIAATLLGRRQAWLLALASVLAVFVLTVSYLPLHTDHDHEASAEESTAHHHAGPELPSAEEAPHPPLVEDGSHVYAHVQTVWIAFPILAALIVYLVGSALRQRDLQLETQRARRARAEHLAELGVIAASAAHELGTPLSTIAVIAKDLECAVARDEAISAEDVRVIRRQVDRCRQALDELWRHARRTDAERRLPCSIGDIVDDLTSRHRDADVTLSITPAERSMEVMVPRSAVGFVLRAILDNALKASAPDEPVSIGASHDDDRCKIVIEDGGTGMTDAQLERIGEQPISTRAPTSSGGMGVGLFLSRAVMESVGGHLTVHRRPRGGTSVALSLPRRMAGSVGPDEPGHPIA